MMVLTHGVCLFIYLCTGNGIWNITEIIRGLGCLFPRGGFVCFFQVPEGTSRPGSLYSKLRVWCFWTNQVIWSQVHGKADLLPVHSYFWNAAIWGPNSTALVGGRLPGVNLQPHQADSMKALPSGEALSPTTWRGRDTWATRGWRWSGMPSFIHHSFIHKLHWHSTLV